MKLTLESLENIRFKIMEKGYSPKEVDDFVDRVIEDLKCNKPSIKAKDIENAVFKIAPDGYSPKEVDEFLDLLIEDYKSFESKSGTIIITKNFDGTIGPTTIEYEGTIQQWRELRKSNILNEIPCVNCADGQLIQKL